jgi:Family of unknown function (DUF6325)
MLGTAPAIRGVAGVSIGPVEYLIIAFPGNKFTGEIAPALGRLIGNGTVRIIDLIFVNKDANGNVNTFEFDQLEELAPFADLEGEAGGLLSQQDIDYAAAAIEPNSSAALLIWEDTWATELAEAIRNSGGVFLEGARVPHDLVEQAMTELTAAMPAAAS